MMDADAMPVVFTPTNEPYLGRNLLFHFDHIISSAMRGNAAKEPHSQGRALSIMLWIRELIRQGDLFGPHVLSRALVEPAALLLLSSPAPGRDRNVETGLGRDLTASMNTLPHAKPVSAPSTLVSMGEGRLGHAVSKILNRPDLRDDLCANMILWVAVVQGMMAATFANEATAERSACSGGGAC